MTVGLTVNKIHQDLLSLWWAPGHHLDSLQVQFCGCIFYGIAEVEHVVPHAFEDKRSLWRETDALHMQQ